MTPKIVNPELYTSLAKDLKHAGITFSEHGALGGARPDFLIGMPDGRKIALEVREWSPTPTLLERAEQVATNYINTAHADRSFVIVKGLKNSRPEKGLLAPEDVVGLLGNLEEQPTKRLKKQKPEAANKVKLIFVAMPFHKRFTDTFWVAMVPAAERVGAACKRLDKAAFSGDIINTMKSWIKSCDAVIADISGSNPNVLYEVGYAHALGKPTIHLCSSPLKKLPFDVSTWPTLQYEIGQVSRLTPKLARHLKGLL